MVRNQFNIDIEIPKLPKITPKIPGTTGVSSREPVPIESDILSAMNGGASYEARFVVVGSVSNEVCCSRWSRTY